MASQSHRNLLGENKLGGLQLVWMVAGRCKNQSSCLGFLSVSIN